MTRDEFEAELRAAGFSTFAEVTREADGHLDTHSHPFEARALILAGEISIETAGTTRRYGPGDIFHLAAAEPHSERYGPAGVHYLAARR
ncbi:cupin [Zoogloea sp.]|uniref:cupin domain-containing protein n=1 Tax=Zoogloea sp. TaxID=49181 RepID=UPI001415B18F|nr:MAG: cupin [Zoogloea sp.]